MSLISIIIPVYKSSESLKIIASELSKMETELGYSFEIIFVNDSPFFLETKKMLDYLEQEYVNIKTIAFRKNQGQHIATLAGINRSNGDYVITMDDDLQHPINEIPKLINAITSNVVIEGVFAVPNYLERKHSLWRSFGSYVFKKIDVIFLDKPKGLVLSSFRIMSRDLGKSITKNYNAMPAVSSLMVNATSNLKNIKVDHENRMFESTNYNLSKLITLSLNGILYYSSLPLRILGFIGIIGFLGSMIFIFSIVFRKLLIGIDYPGYASTVSLISFFGGLNLLAFGIIGEYLIRIIKEQQKTELEDLIK
ncbi:dolichol-phosphate mannosyltransferase/undecaprenyl-phosphate 4-deoxy-4-formamido-L-arabinose transferase [Gillisia sp. Hel_I_86]|uniref:glycosyltransferase n=1 Tax=Gillisia sp. Hel_I_86 TaxID=1249981 RepID=UPI00119A0AFD|nr:glycosyltransferase [Gillisia sp. Hel_I_86]TVZ28203.1 dolichol-phosphate mannosyltransferase/undecaprenyl-phosphate 4-deoxy-4-formamido-L-arabinose transferase [Gillisia sp. Hel_I_86]